jgi:hypothetical protein
LDSRGFARVSRRGRGEKSRSEREKAPAASGDEKMPAGKEEE